MIAGTLALADAPPAMSIADVSFVVVDGVRIRYVRGGRATGVPILLLGPWPESIFAYAPTWETFSRLGPVTAVDLPGYGGSEGRVDLRAPEALGTFIPRIMEALDLHCPHAVGPDIATSASLYAALLHPGIFASLIVGGGATDPTDIGSELGAMVNAPDLQTFESMTGEDFVRGGMAKIEQYSVPDWIVDDYIASYAGHRFIDSVMYVRQYPTALPFLSARLGEIETPCQIIVGERDPYVPVSNARLLHRGLPRSRLDILPCGHFAWEDAAVAYGALAREWIEAGHGLV